MANVCQLGGNRCSRNLSFALSLFTIPTIIVSLPFHPL
jgi:hypothetical protein